MALRIKRGSTLTVTTLVIGLPRADKNDRYTKTCVIISRHVLGKHASFLEGVV